MLVNNDATYLPQHSFVYRQYKIMPMTINTCNSSLEWTMNEESGKNTNHFIERTQITIQMSLVKLS